MRVNLDVPDSLKLPKEYEKLEAYIKGSKFINLIPSDVRNRPVVLFKNTDELKSKLDSALKNVAL